MLKRVLAALMLAVANQAPVPAAQPAALQVRLRALVDLRDPAARARQAAELAADRSVPIAAWVAAMRAFGEFAAPAQEARGEQRHRVDLHVGGGNEATDLFVYVPASYDPARAAPLMLMAHGTGGSGAGLAAMWRATAEELGMIVLAPSEAGANDGYAFSARERQAALAALRWARRGYHIDENRIFGSGISRGGHLVWDLALRYPDLFAAIAPMIGGPRVNTAQGQNNLRYLENVRHLSIRDLQGARDDPRLVRNLRLAFSRLAEMGAVDARLLEFAEHGHGFDFAAVDWREFLQRARRSPVPLAVVRAFARPGEGRAAFVEVLAATPPVSEAIELRLPETEWQRLQRDDEALRQYLDQEATRRTARLEVTRLGGNRFRASTRHVARFRLLLSDDMFDRQHPIELEVDGRKVSKRAALSPAVLLREFAERFDRTFLPIAEVVWPAP